MLEFFLCFYFHSFSVCFVQLFPLSFTDFSVVYSPEGRDPAKKSVLSCIFATLTGGKHFSSNSFSPQQLFLVNRTFNKLEWGGGDCALVLLSYFFKA